MDVWGRILLGAAVVAGTVLLESPAAWANDYGWKDGRWRLGLSGFTALRPGNRSRTGVVGLVGSVGGGGS